MTFSQICIPFSVIIREKLGRNMNVYELDVKKL